MDLDHELSSLDQVRQAEAEVARRIAASREKVEQAEAQAREQAKALIEEAREGGRREGQAHRPTFRSQNWLFTLCHGIIAYIHRSRHRRII